MSFAAADTGTSGTKTITRHLDAGADDFVHVPVEVPSGVNKISVSYSYNKPQVTPGLRGNACISTAEATPDHFPGPVGKGTGNIALGSYQVSEQGLDYTVNVTLEYGPDGAAYRPQYPPQQTAGRGAGSYRGDAHLHTVTPTADAHPMKSRRSTRSAPGLHDQHRAQHPGGARRGGPLSGNDLPIITGEEVATRNGHSLASLGLPRESGSTGATAAATRVSNMPHSGSAAQAPWSCRPIRTAPRSPAGGS
ncbi:hypothetical protein [Arthrobacter sp. Soil736]|uniref:hypothetical protein n=1 Tax=Arthrobacter sp. Soil736 TaxID=1736395 RepID=UPI0012F82788|nr:hypothetical protein [Arthrobacter sp. Soil736]